MPRSKIRIEFYSLLKLFHALTPPTSPNSIVITGYSETDRVKEAEKLGVNGFIQKPYKIDDIGEILGKVLSSN